MAMTSKSRRPPESEFQAVRPAMVKVQLSDNYGMKILSGSWQNRDADVLQLWWLACTALMGTVVQWLAMDTLVHCQVELVRDVSATQTQWATLTFYLAFRWAFRWAKLRSKSRLKWKSTRKPSYRWQTHATRKPAEIASIRHAYNVVVDNTGLSSCV